jgi:hypothetical protein
MAFLKDIAAGFQRLPRWVQFWLSCVLVPVNLISVVFVGEPGGWIVAVLAIGGIAPNAVILVVTRDFGREMTIAHLILWPPLFIVIIWLLREGPQATYVQYLWVLLIVDVISVAFDIRDARNWLQSKSSQRKNQS